MPSTRQLDRLIEWGLAFVLVFTPLAFGAVEPWAESIAQLALVLVFVAWSFKTFVAGRGRFRLSGLEAPALLFAAVVALQLVPLPPSWLQLVSPRTHELYALSVPGYGEPAGTAFEGLPAWLERADDREAGGVPALPADPELASRAFPAGVFDRAWSQWRPISMTPARTRRALWLFLVHLGLFVVVFNHFDRRERVLRFLYLLAGLAGLLALVGLLQYLTGTDRIYGWRSAGSGEGMFGSFVSHNNFAGWMEMVAPICVGLTAMAAARSRERTSGSRGAPLTLLLGFLAVLSVVAFLFARSRGGVLALATAAAIYALVVLTRERPRPRTVISLALMLATAVGLAAWIGGAELWERYRTLGALEREPSFRFRLDTTRRTLVMATDFPLLGTGLGTFQQAYAIYTPGTTDRVLRRTHDDYAQVAAETGGLGALALLWALWVLLRRGGFSSLTRGGSDFRWPVRGVAVGALALLIHSFVDFNLQIYSNSVLFVFLCAILLADHASQLERGTERA